MAYQDVSQFDMHLNPPICVCTFRDLLHGSGLFSSDARGFRPSTAAQRRTKGQIQTLPLQGLRGGIVCLFAC